MYVPLAFSPGSVGVIIATFDFIERTLGDDDDDGQQGKKMRGVNRSTCS